MIEENASPKDKQDDNKNTAANAQSADISTVIPPSQPVVLPQQSGSDPATKPPQTQPEETAEYIEEAMKPFERKMLKATWVGIGLAVITGIIFFLQFHEMGRQTGILRDQAKQAAIDSIEASKKVERQLGISQQQANAAQDSVKAIQQQMRQDQRAWVYVEGIPTFRRWEENKPLNASLSVMNRGKTAAHHVALHMLLEKISIKEMPTFEFKRRPHYAPRTGILVPNLVSTFTIDSVQLNPDGKTAGPWVMSKKDISDIGEGRAYVTLHGTIDYDDLFGIHHWLKYCVWSGGRIDLLDNSKSANACILYNDEDHN